MMRHFVIASRSGSGLGDGGQEVPVVPKPVVYMGTDELDARI